MSEVINVGLYGGKGIFGGKETPLEASIISCDKHESCSFFKNGLCLNVRAPFSSGCKFGSTNTVRGYTSRAKKYSEFKRKWQQHEAYSKLSRPPQKLGIIDGIVVFPYPYIRIIKTDRGLYRVEGPALFSNDVAYIELEKFNSDLIYRICSYRPQAMMGGEITDYQKEKVPLFLAHLKEVLPKKYEEFVKAYPKYGSKTINYVGRKALLKTIKPSAIHDKSDRYPNLNSQWEWDGEFLTYKSGYVSSVSIIKDYEIDQFKLRPSEKTVVEITSNDQVTDETVFVN